MAHDYSNQYSRNDPYRRKEEPSSPYVRSSDPYRRNDDPYKRSDDPYRRNDDPYKKNEDPYRRNDDPYKRTEDPYKRSADPYQRNEPSGRGFTEDPYFKAPQPAYGAKKASGDGFRTDSYRSSGDMDGLNAFGRPDPAIYEVDHLVTFDVSPKLGVKNHNDGMERLKHMELTSGVWTMRHLLSVDDREIVITEKATRKELESFPISRVLDPVNITSSDLKEIYNNIVIFIVQNENSKQAAEMHIFQCIGKPGQDLIDDIEAARMGKFPRPANGKRQSVSSENSEKRRTQYDDNRIVPGNRPSRFLLHSPASRVGSMALPEEMENDVELLNKCFDTIESFVASLQQAANAQKKLVQAKAQGPVDPNDLKYLTDKGRAPPAREFVDTFQKFKLALNLLPRLKAALKDPNAQELTHLLFAPLALVIEASREPDGLPKLAMSVTSPLLNRDTCILLDSSLHANEIDLWRSLGDCWNIPADMWKGPVPPPYVPRFYDNSRPTRLQSNDKNLTVPNGNQVNGGMQNGAKEPGTPNRSNQTSPVLTGAINAKQEEYLKVLKLKKAKAFKIAQGRVSKNPKELTVTAGEFVEVLEDTKKWWKVSNINNESGFVPNTILIAV